MGSQSSAYSQAEQELFVLSQVQEGVKESSMIPEHEGYHHTITAKEAEERLKRRGSHCYLTRYSNTNGCYILSIYQSTPTTTVKHFKIDKSRDGKFKIKNKQMEFDSIEELLAHYEEHTIDPAFKNIGRKYTEDEYAQDKNTKNQNDCIIL